MSQSVDFNDSAVTTDSASKAASLESTGSGFERINHRRNIMMPIVQSVFTISMTILTILQGLLLPWVVLAAIKFSFEARSALIFALLSFALMNIEYAHANITRTAATWLARSMMLKGNFAASRGQAK